MQDDYEEKECEWFDASSVTPQHQDDTMWNIRKAMWYVRAGADYC